MANSQQFYERLRQLAETSKSNGSTSIKNSTLIDFKRADDGTALGIVKENHDYHVKVSKVKGDNLSAADFGYIGGFRNKTENQFNNLSEAQKQRNYRLKSLNEAFSLTGNAYLLKEEAKQEKTPLDVNEDINSFLRNRISEGKKSINETREKNFKTSLLKERDEISRKTGGLMNENALTEIRKAMGIITEEKDLSTADSEIKNSDSVAQHANDPLKKHGKDLSTEDSEISEKDEIANKKGKEDAQAPINDKNAKTHADKAMGKDSMPAKPKSGKSIAVNEGEDLSTADSEISDGEILPNKKDAKEHPQAPINDTNAKKEADKNTAGGKMNEGEKEDMDNDGDIDSDDYLAKKDAAIKKNMNEGDAISTKDSDLDTKDSVSQDKDVLDKPDADYNNYNQPNKGHKEEKGEELKPIKQKGSIVAEGDALSTEDSNADPNKSLANHTNPAPKKTGESLIVADSELEADKSLANESNAAPKKTGDSLITADSELNSEDSLANKTGIREGVEDTLAAAEKKEDELDAVDSEADAEAATDEPMGGDIPVDDMGGDEAPADDTSDIDIDNMDLNVDAEAPAGDEPIDDMGGDEDMPAPDVDIEKDVDVDIEGGDAPEGGDEDPMVKELEKLVGKTGNVAQQVDLDPTKTDELFSALIGNFEKNLAKAGSNKGLEWSDKIEKATAGEGVKDDSQGMDMDVEVDADIETGSDDMEADAAIDQQISDLGGDQPVEEDTPMKVDGEEVIDGDVATELGIETGEEELDEACNECGTFEDYCAGKGMNLGECSGMEIADLISGYADAHKEGMNDGDFEGVAVYLADPQVKADVEDYGHGDYISQADPFMKDIGENAVKYGSYEPMVDPIMGEDDEEEIAVDDMPVDEPVEEPEGGEEIEVLDLTNMPEKPEPTFGADSQIMGAGVVKPESAKQKSVDVDLETGKVLVTVNEEEKLRKLIKSKIQEQLGKKKSMISESEKSKTSKLLDKMINEQLKVYQEVIGKKINK